MPPRVSIGLPLYNGEKYLSEALDSILGQDFTDFELLISDNASTDSSGQICRAYAKRDPRIKYYRLDENLGAAPNYNRVVGLATAPLFKWAAHDDLLRPTFLSSCVAAFDGFETPPALVHPRAEFIDEAGCSIRLDDDRLQAGSRYSWIRAFQALQTMNMMAAIGGVFHLETLKRTRLIGSFVGSDYVLIFEASLLGRIVQLEGEPLFQRRIHEESSRKANLSNEEVLRWFDPKARVQISPRKKIHLEYLKSSARLPGPNPFEKALCVGAVIGGVSLKRTRVVAGKYRRRLLGQTTAD